MAGQTAYFLPGTDTEVTPDSPDWPIALRQVTIVGNKLVEDIVCPFPDINLLHFRNTLVVGRPWGVGEPFYSKKLQDISSKILDDGAQHLHYNAHPAREMHAGLHEVMERQYGNANIKPNDIIPVPAEYWGPQPFVRLIEPPPFPESSFKIGQLAAEKFNRVAGRPDVLSGNTPTPNASGELVANLQNAAAEPLNFKAQDFAFALEKLGKLMMFSILNFRPAKDIAQTTSVPLPLLSLVIERAKGRTPNIKITTSTGAGAALERKKANYVQWNQLVDPADRTPLISGQTVRELIADDANVEQRRNQQAIRNAATVLAPMQAQGDPDQQGGDKGKSANGENGQHSSNGNGRFG
jgi:hypothetical protein